MRRLLQHLRPKAHRSRRCFHFSSCESGATAVEYAVMLAMILAIIFGSIAATGAGAGMWWSDVDDDLQSSGF